MQSDTARTDLGLAFPTEMSQQMPSLCQAAMARLPQGPFLGRVKISRTEFRCSVSSIPKEQSTLQCSGLCSTCPCPAPLAQAGIWHRDGHGRSRGCPHCQGGLAGLNLTAGWALQHGEHSSGDSHPRVTTGRRKPPLCPALPGDRALPAAFTGELGLSA